MGARVYLPSLGRFLSVDPIQGGTPNNYVYPPDAVNDRDLSGKSAKSLWNAIKAYAHYIIGGGKPTRTNVNDFSWKKPSLSKFGVDVNAYKGKSGKYVYGPVPYKNVTSLTSITTNDLGGKAMIGTGTARLTGTLDVSGNKWHFKGYMEVEDKYNFNVRGSNRSVMGQASTIAGAYGGFVAQVDTLGLLDPTDYEDKLIGKVPFEESGSY